MIVVADTSPLNYLIQIEVEEVLPKLYGRVLLPTAVLAELGRAQAVPPVRGWASRLPEWIDIGVNASAPDPTLTYLDSGEREAIQMAQERKARLLLIDERKGTAEALRRGLETTGTLGVLLAAAEVEMLDPVLLYGRLIRDTNFRMTNALEARFLTACAHRKRSETT
jgi:predicted nucleic acid-binding protein